MIPKFFHLIAALFKVKNVNLEAILKINFS